MHPLDYNGHVKELLRKSLETSSAYGGLTIALGAH